MITEWDYTDLAKAYLKRPDYSDVAIDRMIDLVGVKPGDKACDVGAGTAHLTLMLAKRHLDVVSVEPNNEMRKHGKIRTKELLNVVWREAIGEDTGQPDNTFDIVTFGSSFSVTDRPKTMREVARILKENGWLAVMWNHRDLDDPIQSAIENIIRDAIPQFEYGTRREDQTGIINKSGLFGEVTKIQASVIHQQKIGDVIEAWRSHGTLHRQAGEKFDEIIYSIQNMLKGLDKDPIEIPYTTRIWIAQLN